MGRDLMLEQLEEAWIDIEPAWHAADDGGARPHAAPIAVQAPASRPGRGWAKAFAIVILAAALAVSMMMLG